MIDAILYLWDFVYLHVTPRFLARLLCALALGAALACCWGAEG